MTIAPERPVDQPRTKTLKEIFQGAADYLRTHTWMQGTLTRSTMEKGLDGLPKSGCALSALMAGAGYTEFTWENSFMPEVRQARAAVESSGVTHGISLCGWNNKMVTHKERIISTYQQLADRLYEES